MSFLAACRGCVCKGVPGTQNEAQDSPDIALQVQDGKPPLPAKQLRAPTWPIPGTRDSAAQAREPVAQEPTAAAQEPVYHVQPEPTACPYEAGRFDTEEQVETKVNPTRRKSVSSYCSGVPDVRDHFSLKNKATEVRLDVCLESDGKLDFPWEQHHERQQLMPGKQAKELFKKFAGCAMQSRPEAASIFNRMVATSDQVELLFFRDNGELRISARCNKHIVHIYRKNEPGMAQSNSG